jgi:hypothetical protein
MGKNTSLYVLFAIRKWAQTTFILAIRTFIERLYLNHLDLFYSNINIFQKLIRCYIKEAYQILTCMYDFTFNRHSIFKDFLKN